MAPNPSGKTAASLLTTADRKSAVESAVITVNTTADEVNPLTDDPTARSVTTMLAVKKATTANIITLILCKT